MNSATETEIKLRLHDQTAVLDRFPRLGLRVSVPRQFEANTLYDTDKQALRKKEMILRLREVGDKHVITWKGPGEPGPHKSRPELETTIGSLDTLHQILDKLGLHPVFRYEKYRTEFSAGAPGVVTLDETPIGNFLELEGPANWIDQTAAELGFSKKDYILESYGRLYLADCERRGVQPANMVFASH